MCICSPSEKQKTDECMERVLKELQCTRDNLLSKVVYSLQWNLGDKHHGTDFTGTIDGIGCDMWCGISATLTCYKHKPKHRDEDFATIRVQCDQVEDGIARVWELAVKATEQRERDEAMRGI